MNFFDHKDLGNHLLQLCPKVVKHPVYPSFMLCILVHFRLIFGCVFGKGDGLLSEFVSDTSKSSAVKIEITA